MCINNIAYCYVNAVIPFDSTRRFQRDRPEPVTIISNTDVEGAAFLKHAHDRLKEYHFEDAAKRNYTLFKCDQVFSATAPPEFAVLATWNIAAYGAGGAWHGWTDTGNVQKAMFPLNSLRVHVVNEAFSTLQGWAEGSLRAADRVLQDYFSVPRRWSFNVTDNVQVVSQTASDTCVVSPPSGGNETTTGGGNSGGGDTGGIGGGDIDLCFTSSALVHMGDGTALPISRVNEGDVVDTGFGFGRVTKVLMHPVHDEVEVAIIPTSMGDLVGTPDHPIYVGGKWYEIRDAALYGMVNTTMQLKYVDVLYNLEVDGDAIGENILHSYVVNGLVASGLGDHPVLNQMYRRQKVWQHTDISKQSIKTADAKAIGDMELVTLTHIQ